MRAFKLWVVALGLLGLAALAAFGVGLYFYFSPERAVRRALEFERRLAGLARKEAELPNGLHYVYLEGGKGEPVMLLHGFGANKDNFVRVAKYLTPHYRVVIPDHIGFGESAKPPKGDYSPRSQAERLRSLARQLGMPKLHLGGNSMGGHIALTYAALFPAEVKSLWLLAPGGVWSAPASEVRKRIDATGRNPMIVKNEEEFAQLVAGVTAVPLAIPRRFSTCWRRSASGTTSWRATSSSSSPRTRSSSACAASPRRRSWSGARRTACCIRAAPASCRCCSRNRR